MNRNQDLVCFSFPILEIIDNSPTYSDLATLQVKLNANAEIISSTSGGGQHGQLGLTLSAESYKEYTKHDFVPPLNPGTLPKIDTNATITEIEETMQKYDKKASVERVSSYRFHPETTSVSSGRPNIP